MCHATVQVYEMKTWQRGLSAEIWERCVFIQRSQTGQKNMCSQADFKYTPRLAEAIWKRKWKKIVKLLAKLTSWLNSDLLYFRCILFNFSSEVMSMCDPSSRFPFLGYDQVNQRGQIPEPMQ